MKFLTYLFLTVITPITLISQEPGSGHNLQFDGTNYVSISDNATLDLQNSFTIEGWIYPTDNSNNTIIDKGNYQYLFQTHPDATHCLGFYNNVMGWKYSTGTIPINEWSHVAVTFNLVANELIFYLNGSVLSTSSGLSNPILDNGDVNIGRQEPSSCQCNNFNGNLDEIKIWNTVLTQSQIRDGMCSKITASNVNYSNLLSYWKFDSSSGTTLVDSKGNGNDGTLINTPIWNLSGAPIGDASIWLAGVSSGSNINLAHSHGDDLTATITDGTADLFQMYRVDQIPNDIVPPGLYTYISKFDYFGVKMFGSTGGKYSITYNYDGHPGITPVKESTLSIAKRISNATNWLQEFAFTIDETANTIVLPNQTGTEFILGVNGGVALPIELLNFEVKTKSNSEVEINWSISKLVDNVKMNIEKSNDGKIWNSIYEIDGDGTSNVLKKYSFIDRNPFIGFSYYRLRQFDINGKNSYSEIKSTLIDINKSVTIFPNPVESHFVFIGNFESIDEVQLFDVYGQNVTSKLKVVNFTNQKINFDASLLPSQIYTIQNNTEVKRLVKD